VIVNPERRDDSGAVDPMYPSPVLISLLACFVDVHVGDRPSCTHVFAERVRMEVLGVNWKDV